MENVNDNISPRVYDKPARGLGARFACQCCTLGCSD